MRCKQSGVEKHLLACTLLNFLREMREHFLRERARVKKFREEAEKEREAGMQGQWQQESPAREYVEQVKSSSDTVCSTRMMKQKFFALKEIGKVTSVISGTVRRPRSGHLTELRKPLRMQRRMMQKAEHCPRTHAKKYRLFAAYHCASRRERRRHDGILVPTL